MKNLLLLSILVFSLSTFAQNIPSRSNRLPFSATIHGDKAPDRIEMSGANHPVNSGNPLISRDLIPIWDSIYGW
jgi:hypothetical protein